MPRKSRQILNTIVIVCEDSVVTPTYLRKIRAEVLPNGHWTAIAIHPLSKDERATAKNDNPHKSPRRIRQLRPPDKGADPTEMDIEDQYRAVPVRYVREAQLRMWQEGYNEGWAVYDLDGHPAQEAAHQLSQTDPMIGLAFCSVAIEHWFLLHFAQDGTAYAKSENVPLAPYIPNYAKNTKGSIDVYEKTRTHMDIALENAGWLRTINAGKTPPYAVNPYVDMDRLIKRLYLIKEDISWGEVGKDISIKALRVLVENTGTTVKITVVNFSAVGIMSNQIGIYILDEHRKRVICDKPNVLIPPDDAFYWQGGTVSLGLLNLTFESHRLIVPL